MANLMKGNGKARVKDVSLNKAVEKFMREKKEKHAQAKGTQVDTTKNLMNDSELSDRCESGSGQDENVSVAYSGLDDISHRTSGYVRDEDFIKLCQSGTAEEVFNAIRNGAHVNAKSALLNHGALTIAARDNPNALEVIKVLIKTGAYVRMYGGAALWEAIRTNKKPEVITTLINAGANVHETNLFNETLLMLAARFNENPEVITALIDAGVDINARNQNGKTALMVAANETKNPEVLVALINAGADVNIKGENFLGFSTGTALDFARKNSALNGTDALNLLSEKTKGN